MEVLSEDTAPAHKSVRVKGPLFILLRKEIHTVFALQNSPHPKHLRRKPFFFLTPLLTRKHIPKPRIPKTQSYTEIAHAPRPRKKKSHRSPNLTEAEARAVAHPTGSVSGRYTPAPPYTACGGGQP
ncbi:hypothetical protein, unlikely [Trypanosoma congolense IL3000]|uniref:Uncharacterized protein n=1 Tax=Trypanosoma congolense (strain IL3000) TaxID=1068625 RepID=F9WD51_TRYCI|nr:hypothetical protein, unlikely [Trypanosoma congolense IL3000]